jgi:hypothetical protein
MMDDRVAVLEAENEALQVEISRRASCAPQEYLRYGTSASGIRLSSPSVKLHVSPH